MTDRVMALVTFRSWQRVAVRHRVDCGTYQRSTSARYPKWKPYTLAKLRRSDIVVVSDHSCMNKLKARRGR